MPWLMDLCVLVNFRLKVSVFSQLTIPYLSVCLSILLSFCCR